MDGTRMVGTLGFGLGAALGLGVFFYELAYSFGHPFSSLTLVLQASGLGIASVGVGGLAAMLVARGREPNSAGERSVERAPGRQPWKILALSLLALVLVSALVLSLMNTTAIQRLEDERSELTEQLTTARDESGDLASRVEDLEFENSNLQDEVSGQESTLTSLCSQLGLFC